MNAPFIFIGIDDFVYFMALTQINKRAGRRRVG